MNTIEVNGTTLSYVERGSGELLIFVHGSLDNYRAFKAQVKPFSSSYHVLAYSRRFHPPNVPPAEDSSYTLLQQSEDLFGLIQAIHAGPAHLACSSYGAYTALVCAVHHPESVKSMILGEPPMLRLLMLSEEGSAAFQGFQSGAIIPSRRAFEKGDETEGVRRFVGGIKGTPDAFDRLPDVVRNELLKMAPEMRAEMTAEFDVYMPPVTCEQIHDLQQPVLLVEGEQSPRFFHIITDELARCLRKAERVVIPRAGHTMHASNPVAYRAAVLSFLQRCATHTEQR